MQTVSTSARRAIVERDLQVVISQEPIEGGPRLFPPTAFSRSAISLQASRHHGTSFDRLLIEARLFRFPRIEAMLPDRPKMTFYFAALNRPHPIPRFQSGLHHLVLTGAHSRTN